MQNTLKVGQRVVLFADNVHDACGQRFESKVQATYLGEFLNTGSGEMMDVYEFCAPMTCPFCGGIVQHFCAPVGASFHLTNLEQVKGLKNFG